MRDVYRIDYRCCDRYNESKYYKDFIFVSSVMDKQDAADKVQKFIRKYQKEYIFVAICDITKYEKKLVLEVD